MKKSPDIVTQTTEETMVDQATGATARLTRKHDGTWRWHLQVPIFADKSLSASKGVGEGMSKTHEGARRAVRRAMVEKKDWPECWTK